EAGEGDVAVNCRQTQAQKRIATGDQSDDEDEKDEKDALQHRRTSEGSPTVPGKGLNTCARHPGGGQGPGEPVVSWIPVLTGMTCSEVLTQETGKPAPAPRTARGPCACDPPSRARTARTRAGWPARARSASGRRAPRDRARARGSPRPPPTHPARFLSV